MPSSPKRKSSNNQVPSWIRYTISFFYELGLFRIGAIALVLLFVITKGDLLTKNGLILILIILLFFIVYFLSRWINKDD